MAVIHVHKAFTLNRPGHDSARFGVGRHEVDAQTAKHWYVAAHAEVEKTKPNRKTESDTDGHAP